MRPTLAGAATGALAGLAARAVGELLVLLIAQLYPTDVLITGFAMIWAVPAGVLVGAIVGWRGWLDRRSWRVAAAAVPGLLAAVAAAPMQWSAV